MCDLYSWGVMLHDKNVKGHRFHKGQIIFLTDVEAESVSSRSIREGIGHEAIADYYHLDALEDFRHEEGLSKVPAPVYAEISKGSMRKMTKAVNPEILKLTYHEEHGMFVVDEDNLTWQMKSPEYEVVFDACRKWLDANYPGVADEIMVPLLRNRDARRNPFNGKKIDSLPIPAMVVDRLLNWGAIGGAIGEQSVCENLHKFIERSFSDK